MKFPLKEYIEFVPLYTALYVKERFYSDIIMWFLECIAHNLPLTMYRYWSALIYN